MGIPDEREKADLLPTLLVPTSRIKADERPILRQVLRLGQVVDRASPAKGLFLARLTGMKTGLICGGCLHRNPLFNAPSGVSINATE